MNSRICPKENYKHTELHFIDDVMFYEYLENNNLIHSIVLEHLTKMLIRLNSYKRLDYHRTEYKNYIMKEKIKRIRDYIK